MHHRSGEKNENIIFAVISIILAILFVCLYFYSEVQDRKRLDELKVIYQNEQDRQQNKKEEIYREQMVREDLESNDSFYQKLADGFDVNVLIVGDSIGQGTGATGDEHKWSSLLQDKLHEIYNVGVTVTNISMGGNSSYAGYVRTLALNDEIEYDLVIVCYGQNDAVQDFGIYYEAMIRRIKNSYPKASILSILESSQRDYTEKMNTIMTIAEHYGIPIVDTIAPFQADYDSLVNDLVHPNDYGHAVYCDTILNVISSMVDSRREYDPEDISIMDDQVRAFESGKYFGVDTFRREGNTFVSDLSIQGSVLGIDYNFTAGNNSCKIYIDDIEYAAPEVEFNYDFSQRHIMVVNDWLNGENVVVQNEIKVVFAEDEEGTKQADGFRGLIISGQ